MYDIDEDGSLKPYTAHYVIAWGCIVFLFYLLIGVAAAVLYIFR